jgi:fibronectin type 3 domain-containing protein
MKRLIQLTFAVVLVVLINGCAISELSVPTSKPKIDERLPVVSSKYIKTISDISSVALEWKGITDSKVRGYYIYRANTTKDGRQLKRIAALDSKYASHYLDKNLIPNSQYLYSISTIGDNGMESRISESILVQTKPRPKSVSFITAISDLPRQVKILWRPHVSQRVAKYIIERRVGGSSKYRAIKTIRSRLEVEYIDKDLMDNTQYSYRIKAVTFDKIHSFPSQEVQATTKALPTSVTNMRATVGLPRVIRVTWNHPKQMRDIVSYRIYSSDEEDGSFKKIANLHISSEPSYEHNIKEDGKVKFYKITTVDKDDLESTIKIAPIMGKTLHIPALPVITLAMIKDSGVVLNWKAGDNRTVAYNLHKTIKENFLLRKTESILSITDLRFEDKDILRGVTYEYQIEAIDENGLVSDKTPVTTLTIPKLEKGENASSTVK